MNKIILAGFMALLTTAAQAQNCVAPSRCAELGYRDDVGKCSGLKTLLCPFDSNKAFCIGADGGSGFYTCEDFLEAIKEVDGTIFLSRGLECDMTGKATEIRFAEGLKIIGTSDQPKIEFINYGKGGYPDLMLGGRNSFENLRIINADITTKGEITLNNVQAESITSGTAYFNNVQAFSIHGEEGGTLTFEGINNVEKEIDHIVSSKYANVDIRGQVTAGSCNIMGKISGKLKARGITLEGPSYGKTTIDKNAVIEVGQINCRNNTVDGTVKLYPISASTFVAFDDCKFASTSIIDASTPSEKFSYIFRSSDFEQGATIIIGPETKQCPDSIGTWIAQTTAYNLSCPSEPYFTKVQ